MAPWVTPLPRVSSATLISLLSNTRSNTARRVGSARARITLVTGFGAASIMANDLVNANQLVNANPLPVRLEKPLDMTDWSVITKNDREAQQDCHGIRSTDQQPQVRSCR